MYSRLHHHLHTDNKLVAGEFGFGKGIATETAAFKEEMVYSNLLTKNMHVGGIFCDITKASDCVNY
jgi:hypothetical protein